MRMAGAALLVIALVSSAASAHTDKTAAEIRAMLDAGGDILVVDMREASEFCDSTYHPPGHIIGAVNMPWNSGYLQAYHGELDPNLTTIVVCRSGGRSNAAANFLDGVGFTAVFDMLGGMNAWLWQTQGCYTASVPGPEAVVKFPPFSGQVVKPRFW
ncbi:MAG: rhodanese-like domain-containing protein [Candidatus Eisenbacteria bacterium]